jgi:hypothetical protein
MEIGLIARENLLLSARIGRWCGLSLRRGDARPTVNFLKYHADVRGSIRHFRIDS